MSDCKLPACMRGKRVDVSDNGLATFRDVIFHDVIIKEESLKMNWRHLHNMAQTIVDNALGRLAIDGSLNMTLMHLQLGSMLVDTNRVRVDEQSYFDMKKKITPATWSMHWEEHAWKKAEFKCVCDSAYKKHLQRGWKLNAVVVMTTRRTRTRTRRAMVSWTMMLRHCCW
jgi:hypothetical protein